MLAQTFQARYIKLLFTYTLTVIGMTHICLHVVLNLMRASERYMHVKALNLVL